MSTLKELRNRIASVKSTQKITSAMKMVAASKLRRAQEQAEAARPYAERMGRMLGSLAANMGAGTEGPALLSGSGKDDAHLLVVVTSDRGLCGGFNGNIVRRVRREVDALLRDGKTVKILCVGRKGRDQLRREHRDRIIASFDDLGKQGVAFSEADEVARKVLTMYEDGEFDVCRLMYNRFQSVMAQVPTDQQIVPFKLAETGANDNAEGGGEQHPDSDGEPRALYEFEPDEESILADLLPRNLSIQIYSALLESAAGEQAARMTAMDSATRNAGEMIDKLTITYNRSRQAVITKELIEIISGAEAV